MKKIVMLLSLVSTSAFAQEVRVISVQPKFVTTYQQQCQQVQVQSDNSGVGAVIGGIAGGIIGNQVGKGSGKDAATVAGAIVGGMVGNRIGSDQTENQVRQQCTSVPVQVQRGEIVTFSYKGRVFTQSID